MNNPLTLKDFVAEAKARITEITLEEALRRVREGRGRVLDVREPAEYLKGAIPGAFHVPRGMLEAKADTEYEGRDPELQDRGQSWILVCKSGARSAMAAAALQRMGFGQVVSLAGGMDAWTKADYPKEQPPATKY